MLAALSSAGAHLAESAKDMSSTLVCLPLDKLTEQLDIKEVCSIDCQSKTLPLALKQALVSIFNTGRVGNPRVVSGPTWRLCQAASCACLKNCRAPFRACVCECRSAAGGAGEVMQRKTGNRGPGLAVQCAWHPGPRSCIGPLFASGSLLQFFLFYVWFIFFILNDKFFCSGKVFWHSTCPNKLTGSS